MEKKITKIEPVRKQEQQNAPMMKRVCAYCRVSTASGEQKHSLEAQKRYYTKLIQEKEHWIWAGIYADEAQSGTKLTHREQFLQMIQDCKKGKIDLILTKSITRFARNTVGSISTIRMLKDMGVEVYFEKEKISTFSEKSEQLLTILSSIAQSEAENISANSKWAVQRRFQNGTYKISTPAYGYEKDENGELVIQLEEAKVVRRIFEAYLSGKGCYTIAKELQAEGVPTIRNKGKWHEVVVQEILLNPVYAGNLIYQKTYSTSCLPFTRKRNHGTYPKYLITENHPPIITKEEAEAVRQIYEYRSQSAKNKASFLNRYVFSGCIRCGVCGNVFRRQKIYMGKPYEAIQWCCKQHLQDMTKCDQKAVREEVIQEVFVHLWNRLVGAYEEIFLPLLSALKAAPEDGEREQEQWKNRIQEIQWQCQMLQKVLSEGSMDAAIFIEKRNALERELETARRNLRKLQDKGIFEEEIAQTEYLIAVFRLRPKVMETFQKEVFTLIVEQVTVYENHLEFQLKNGLILAEVYGKER